MLFCMFGIVFSPHQITYCFLLSCVDQERRVFVEREMERLRSKAKRLPDLFVQGESRSESYTEIKAVSLVLIDCILQWK